MSDSITKAPIEGVEVCATFYPDVEVAGCDTTDSSGNYQIGNLEPNVYGLSFQTQLYEKEWLDWAPAHQGPVVLGSEPITVDQELKRYGRIEGVVTESGSGEPIENAWVCPFGFDSDHETGACDYTDEDGRYLITGLQKPGDYKVRFIAPIPDGLLAQWYDLKEYEQSDIPNPVPVELANTTTGINAELFPGARVEGTVRSADTGQPFYTVRVCAREASGWIWACAAPDLDGRYKIIGLPVDDYLIEFLPLISGIDTQYWDHAASPNEADLLSLARDTTTVGIDASMTAISEPPKSGSPDSPTPFVQPLLPVLTPAPMHASTPTLSRHCRGGFHRKRSRGRARCVRSKRRRHNARPSGGTGRSPGRPLDAR